MLNNTLENIIRDLYAIPNAPFSPYARSKYIKRQIEEAGLSVEDNQYYIRGRDLKKDGLRKIIFISHLDHPGFIFKNNREGYAFGSLYLDRIKEYAPISVYDQGGEYLGDAKITKVFGRDESRVNINADFHIPINSQGLWNVGEARIENSIVYGRSHDNDIATSILIYCMRNIKREDFDISFVFTKSEEVLQQSAYNIAKNNSLNINTSDIIINLESMNVYPTTDKDEYSNLKSENGVVLNISEANVIYGSNSIHESNVAESIINNISKKFSLKIQQGLAGGSSDARVFSMFNLTPNIVTLNIPNRFKHNFDGNRIVAEQIYTKDINTLTTLVQKIVGIEELNLNRSTNDISLKVKSEFIDFKSQVASYYLRLNERLDISNRGKMKRGYFFPINIYDRFTDLFYKVLSYLYFYTTNRGGRYPVSKD